MNKVRRALGAGLVVSMLWVGPTHATSFSTDQSDIWNAANEAGWAAEFVHRGSTIFAVIYVYSPTGAPLWYSAALEFTGQGGVATRMFTAISKETPTGPTDIPRLLEVLNRNGVTIASVATDEVLLEK